MPVAPEPKSGISPKWIGTLVGCGLVIFIVIKKVDDISEAKAVGASITFRGSASASTLPPEQQRELSRQVQAKVEAALQQAAHPLYVSQYVPVQRSNMFYFVVECGFGERRTPTLNPDAKILVIL